MRIVFAFLLSLAVPCLAAGQERDSEFPEALDDSHFAALMNDSPFLRTLDPSETFRLRGLATIGGEQVATLFNQKTEKSMMVTVNGGNEWGLKLVDVNESDDLTGVSVRLAMSGEEFELKYEAARVAPAPHEGKRHEVKRDSRGNVMPPQPLIDKYRSMTDDQRKKYMAWREVYYRKHPELERSEKRFPIVEKVIDTIKSGKAPPKP